MPSIPFRPVCGFRLPVAVVILLVTAGAASAQAPIVHPGAPASRCAR